MAFLHTGKQARESITHNPSHPFFFVFADFHVVLVLLSVQDMGGGGVLTLCVNGGCWVCVRVVCLKLNTVSWQMARTHLR